MDYFENNCLSFDGKDNDVNNDPQNDVGNRNKMKEDVNENWWNQLNNQHERYFSRSRR